MNLPVELNYGDRYPPELMPMFGREVCSDSNVWGRPCDLAAGHTSWHAQVDAAGEVVRSWSWDAPRSP